jgi:putative oxidoreductase
MNDNTSHALSVGTALRLEHLIRKGNVFLDNVATRIAPLVLRLALALPFFKSGLTRWDGFASLSPSTAFLFENVFRLHIWGETYPFPAPIAVAHLVGTAEIVLPILLVLGLGTRFVALGLLGNDRSNPACGARRVAELPSALGGNGTGHHDAGARASLT